MSRLNVLSIIGCRSKSNCRQVGIRRKAQLSQSVNVWTSVERVWKRFFWNLGLFGVRFRAYSMDMHRRRVVKILSFQRSDRKRAPEATCSFLNCGLEPKFICLCANHYLLFFHPKIQNSDQKKKLKLNFTDQWKFRKNANQLGRRAGNITILASRNWIWGLQLSILERLTTGRGRILIIATVLRSPWLRHGSWFCVLAAREVTSETPRSPELISADSWVLARPALCRWGQHRSE